ncbi:hypothetical protein BH11PLA2_BH11PLA2_29110 [soil metagenome]
MTETAQPHTEFNALLARVKEQVTACELTEAILVDDQLEVDLTHPQWIQAVGQLKAEDRDAYTKLYRYIGEEGTGNVEEWPAEEIRPKALEIVNESKSTSAIATLKQVRFKEAALEKLVVLLKKVGIDAVCKSRVTDDDPPRTGKLYFLDYRMQGNDQTAGLDAAKLLRDLVKREDVTPPSAILMSRGENNHPTQPEWEQVAKDAGYFRFNFRYLDKGKMETGEMAFLFFLHELLESYPIGKKYYAQLQELRKAAKSAADAALKEIRQLSPAEFSIYAGKYLGDGTGRKASRHVLNLFLGLLDAEVKNNGDLEAGFRTFADMLMKTPMMATKDKDTHKLHDLHTRLLYDRSEWVLTGPIVFGDMYQKPNEPDTYYLVITPECDLDPRDVDGVWIPKTPQILLIRGRLTTQPTDKHPESYVGMPFVSEKETRYIRWQLRDAHFVSSETLVAKAATPPDPNGYVKWGRLRNVEAEHVQQEYASDLVEVGLDDISGLTQARVIEYWQIAGSKEERKPVDLVIVETANLKDEKKPYFWAFGEGCELILCPDSPGQVFFTFAEFVKLRTPTPRRDFIDECKKKNLQLIDTEGEPLRFVWSKTSFKGGKGGWKPKVPVTAQPACEQPTAETPQPGDAPPAQGPQAMGDQPTAIGNPPAVPPVAEAKTGSVIDLTDEGPGLPTDKK